MAAFYKVDRVGQIGAVRKAVLSVACLQSVLVLCGFVCEKPYPLSSRPGCILKRSQGNSAKINNIVII